MKFECGPKWDTRIINIKPKGKIGILMSGGGDSYILYEILKSIPNCPPILIFNIKSSGTAGEGWDKPETVKLLTDRDDIIVVDKFLKHTINDSPDFLSWDKVLILTNLWIVKEYNLDILYNGTNMNPPVEFFPEFTSEEFGDAPLPHWSIPEYTKVICPFLHFYKYHIIDLGIRNNIDISQTHSCNDLPTDEGHCGKCRSCLEKQWAYKQLENKEEIVDINIENLIENMYE